jgi:hypothetical protein
MFKFNNKNPKDNLKEFGNHTWYKNNIKPVVFVYLVYFSLFFAGQQLDFNESINNILLICWSTPLLIMSFGSKTLSRYGFTILCFWYVPYLFYKAKDEEI